MFLMFGPIIAQIKCRNMYSYVLLTITACRLQRPVTDFLKFKKSHDSKITGPICTSSKTQNFGTQIMSHSYITTCGVRVGTIG
jgi:hypothetical protein